MIRLFALAMRGDSFTHAQVAVRDIDRTLAIPKFDPHEARLKPPMFKKENHPRDIVQDLCSDAISDAIWKMVRFSAESLSRLKMAANCATENAIENHSLDEASGR